MPTAGKLIAAAAFALVGWLAARAYVPQLPEGTNIGYFPEITALMGLLIGWFTLGPAAGRRSYVEGGSLGLRTSILVVFWALLGFSTYYMVLRSTRMIYKDAGAAVLDVPLLMLQYGKLVACMPVLMVLVVGGILGGLVTEYAGRHWR